MALPATDNFNRADGGLGSNWTTQTGFTAPAISGNRVVSGGGYGFAYWNADVFNDAQYSQVIYYTSGGEPGVTVRASGSRGYWLYLASAGSNTTNIFRYDSNGNYSNLAGLGSQIGNGDTGKLTANGSTIEAFKNGVSIGSVTDTTYSSGSAGIEAGTLDDWEGGNLGGGGGGGSKAPSTLTLMGVQ
jgi:hypothetical protein